MVQKIKARAARVYREAVVLTSLIALASMSGIAAITTAAIASAPAEVIIDIESPLPGEVVRNKNDVASIRGAVRSGAPDPLDFDVLVAIDVSKSTQYPSGIDVNEDGEIGFNPHEELVEPGTYPDEVVCTDPGDTILAAEIKAARMLVESLSPERSMVGVITFSGEVNLETGERKDPHQKDAKVKIPLSNNFEDVYGVLDEILKEGPHGSTNFAAAVRLGVRELVGLSGAKSQPRLNAKKLMQFLTDGVPTFPFGRGDVSDPEDIDAAINAARLANKAGITINTFALGRYALASPVATTEIARLTGGIYTPVRNPGEILAFLQGISFANVDDVVILNTTTQEISYDVQLAPDGSFRGFVPVVEGPNALEITALAGDGGQTTIQFDLDFEKAGLTEHELQVELERIRKRNKELMLLLERKRIEEFRKSQRKRVEFSAD